MNKNISQNQKGFTLVELSIVLVIIGLLIGGILVAQSLIESTRTQAFIRQLGQFDAAVSSFQDRFGLLPGDNSVIGSAINSGGNVNRGGNDGTIDCAEPNSCDEFGGDTSKFWSDLSVSGLKSDNGVAYTDNSTISLGELEPGEAPEAKLGENASILAVGNSGQNFYAVADFGEPEDSLLPSPAFTPTEVLAVDRKIDDGIASSGNVIPADSGNDLSVFRTLGTGLTTGTTCTTTAGGANYNVANDNVACTMRIRIGATSGILY